MGPLLLHSSVVEHDDPVREANRGEAVGDQDRRLALFEILETLEELSLALGIQGGRGLVEDQEVRATHERTSQRQSLPLADGELRSAVVASEDRLVALGKLLDELPSAALSRRVPLEVFIVDRRQPADTDVFTCREVKLDEVLEDHAHPPPDLGRAQLGHVAAVEQDLALRRLVEAG